jgi:integrase
MRAGITTGDVTLHTLRHTALSRMIASGYDDYTVMEISGRSSTRMLGAIHPSHRTTEGPCARIAARGHKTVTNGRRRFVCRG